MHEIIDLKTKKGQDIRLVIDHKTNKIRLMLHHTLLKDCNVDTEYNPIIEAKGFLNGNEVLRRFLK